MPIMNSLSFPPIVGSSRLSEAAFVQSTHARKLYDMICMRTIRERAIRDSFARRRF